MTTIEQYFDKICALAQRHVPSPRMLPVDQAVSATSSVKALLPVPPFNNSAMDGFLINAADAGNSTFRVVGDVPAGSPPLCPGPQEAVRIMTGAPVPDVGDFQVIPVEHTNIPPGPVPLAKEITVHTWSERRHIRHAGSNIAAGETVLKAGQALDPGARAALISVGISEIEGLKAPRVSVIASGSELVPAGESPGVAQLPDSNSSMLEALAYSYGARAVQRYHASDGGSEFLDTLNEAARTSDLIITSGGVSAGAFDVVRSTTQESMWFGEVQQKPGAPQGCGTWKDTPVISLPGNPVAAFVSFHLYVAPALEILSGRHAPAHVFDRPLIQPEFSGRFPEPRDRRIVVPTRIDFSVSPPRARAFHGEAVGSHCVASLAGVNALTIVPDKKVVLLS